MIDPLISKAWKFFRKHQYSAVTELLEPQILRHRDQPDFYRILGLACLYKKDWSGVETYLQRYRQLTGSTEESVLLGLGLSAVQKKDYPEGIRFFLKLQDLKPRNPRARKGLQLIRSLMSNNDSFGADLNTQSWKKVFPREPRQIPWIFILLPPILLVCISGIIIGLHGFEELRDFHVPLPMEPSKHRPGPGDSSPPGVMIQDGGLWTLQLKDDEVREAYGSAQKYFQDYRDSLARFEINRILLSNASQSMKEKARALISYLRDPEFVSFQDSRPYGDVKNAPELFEGCAIKWKGVVSNLQNGKNEINFDFLIGYENAQVVEAVIPVKLYFPVLLKNSQIIELLAVVEKGSPIGLRGISLRDLGYRKP